MPAHLRAADAPEDLWRCHECGWTYPNHHPSAKHRRNHKKQCGKLPGFMKTTDLQSSSPQAAAGSSDDGSSDEEHPRLSDQAHENNGGESSHLREFPDSPSPAAEANVEQISRNGSDPTPSHDGEARDTPKSHEETASSTRNLDLPGSKEVAETPDGSDQGRSGSLGSAHARKGQWSCKHCGWAYPNAHPSAKNRRKHKKSCGVAASHAGAGGSSDEASSDDGNESNERSESQEPLKCNSSVSQSTPRAEMTNGVSAKDTDLSEDVEGRALPNTAQKIQLDFGSSNSLVPRGATSVDGVSGSKGQENLDLVDSGVAMVDEGNIQLTDEQGPGAPDTSDVPMPPIDNINSSQSQVLGGTSNGSLTKEQKPGEPDGTVIDQQPVDEGNIQLTDEQGPGAPYSSDVLMPFNNINSTQSQVLGETSTGSLSKEQKPGEPDGTVIDQQPVDEGNIQLTDEQGSGAPDTSDVPMPPIDDINSSQSPVLGETSNGTLSKEQKPGEPDGTVIDQQPVDEGNIQLTDEQGPGAPDTSDVPMPPIDNINSSQSQVHGETSNGTLSKEQKPGEPDGTVIDQQPVDEGNTQLTDEQGPGAPDTSDVPMPPIDNINSSQSQVLGETSNGTLSKEQKPGELDGTVIDQQPPPVTIEHVEDRKPHLPHLSQPSFTLENVGKSINDQEEGDSASTLSQSPVTLGTNSRRDSVGRPQLDVKNRQPNSATRAGVREESLSNSEERSPSESPQGFVRSRVQIFEKLAGTSPQYLRKSFSPTTNSVSPRLPRWNETTDGKITGSDLHEIPKGLQKTISHLRHRQSDKRGTESTSKQDAPNELQDILSHLRHRGNFVQSECNVLSVDRT